MGERERTRIGRTAAGRGLGRFTYLLRMTMSPLPHAVAAAPPKQSRTVPPCPQTTIRSRSGADDVPLGPKAMVLLPAFRVTVTAYVPTTL